MAINSFSNGNFINSLQAAGKNKIINGDFGIWQRGTSFTNPAEGAYTADRYVIFGNGTGRTRTVTRESFALGTAPVAGYESTFFLQVAQTVAGTGATYNSFFQRIEDVRQFAGQTATFSFWAKAGAGVTLPTLEMYQDFGSGGSAGVTTTTTVAPVLTTAWTRYTVTIAVPSIAGKTIGTGSSIAFIINLPLNVTSTIGIWGQQVESGSTATAFQTATGTIQGELAACQRYYEVVYPSGTAYAGVATAVYTSATLGRTHPVFFKVTKRISSSTITITGTYEVIGVGTVSAVSAAGEGAITDNYIILSFTTSGRTVANSGYLRNSNDTTANIIASAEL
jgi:hypothetical protein